MSRAPLQHGAATLVVVMILFFVMALVAAYANRNLVVEQRVAASYQEALWAQQAAQRGADTLLSLLNAAHVSEQCQLDPTAANTLRERLLQIDEAGRISPHVADNLQGDGLSDVLICDQPTQGSWACQCPLNLSPSGLSEASQRSSSARLRISAALPAAGHLEITSLGCAQGSRNCKEQRGLVEEDVGFFAQVRQRVRLVLVSALKMPPTTALVAAGSVNLGSGMAAANDHAATGGVAIEHGLPASGARHQVRGPGGSGPALVHNPALNHLDPASFFLRSFGMSLADYRSQAALEALQCSADCTPTLHERVQAGAQLLWHEGDLNLHSDALLGSPARPIVLIVNRRLRIQGSLRIHGLLFSAADAQWLEGNPGASWLNGGLLVAGNWTSSSGVQLRHDPAVLNRLRVAAGTFVRAPGGTWSEQ